MADEKLTRIFSSVVECKWNLLFWQFIKLHYICKAFDSAKLIEINSSLTAQKKFCLKSSQALDSSAEIANGMKIELRRVKSCEKWKSKGFWLNWEFPQADASFNQLFKQTKAKQIDLKFTWKDVHH